MVSVLLPTTIGTTSVMDALTQPSNPAVEFAVQNASGDPELGAMATPFMRTSTSTHALVFPAGALTAHSAENVTTP